MTLTYWRLRRQWSATDSRQLASGGRYTRTIDAFLLTTWSMNAETEPVKGIGDLDRDLSVGCSALTGHGMTQNLVFAVGGDQPTVSLAIGMRGVSSCSGEIAGGGEEPQPAILGAQVVEQNLQTLLVVRVDEVQEDRLAVAEDQPTGRRDRTGDVNHWFIRILAAAPGVVPTVARKTRQCGGPWGSGRSRLRGG